MPLHTTVARNPKRSQATALQSAARRDTIVRLRLRPMWHRHGICQNVVRSLKDCHKTSVFTRYLYKRLMAALQAAKSLPGIYHGDAMACCNIDPSGLGREWLSLHRHPIFRKLTSENRTSAITSYTGLCTFFGYANPLKPPDSIVS